LHLDRLQGQAAHLPQGGQPMMKEVVQLLRFLKEIE